MDPEEHERETGSAIDEIEADIAYQRRDEIVQAATWCMSKTHQMAFLAGIRAILDESRRRDSEFHFAIVAGTVQPSHPLEILTASQALRLLECYKRATVPDQRVWRARGLKEIEDIEADLRLRGRLARIRERIENEGSKPSVQSSQTGRG